MELSDTSKTIKEMAKMIVLSNRISDVHEKNIKMWPFIMFNGVSTVKIDYDLSRRDDVDIDNKNNLTVKSPIRNSFIAYYLSMDPYYENLNPNLDKRFKALEDSVRSLFWKDISVEVFVNDIIKYKSVKNG